MEYPSVQYKDAIRAFMTELRAIRRTSRIRHGGTLFRRCDFALQYPGCVLAVDLGRVVSRAVHGVRGGPRSRLRWCRGSSICSGARHSHACCHSETPEKANTEIKTGPGRGWTVGSIPSADREGSACLLMANGVRCMRVDLFRRAPEVEESEERLMGAVQWISKDFTTPLRAENPVPRINQLVLLGAT